MLRKLMPAVLLAATLGGTSVVNAADCADRGSTYARLLQPQGGMLQVQTTPTGPIVVQSGVPVPGIFISTTGQIDVEMEYSCLESLTLLVLKDGNLAPIHTNSWSLACEAGTKTDPVAIGLDGGSYEFQLSGTSCDGRTLRGDGQGGVVADPPVL